MCGKKAAEPTLTGTLCFVPFKGLARDQTIREQLSTVVEAVDGPQIDVVTRFPTGVEQVEAALAGNPTTDSQSLSVETLSEHALATVNECTDGMQWVSAPAENALLVDFAQAYEWNTEYLQSASKHDSFHRDLRSFVADAMRYPELGEPTDPVMRDLLAFTDSFYEFLLEQEYVPREAGVRVAIEQFRDGGLSDVSQPDGMLAVQFGEFTAVERLYLAYLTDNSVFRAVAREQASIFRAQFEPGEIGEQTALEIERVGNLTAPRTPEAIGEWLARDGSVSLDGPGAVRRLHADTYEEHIRSIGTAIQYLQGYGEALSDIAVVFRDSTAPIGDAVDILWNMGVPVSSTVTAGLEHDTAVREIYTVVRCLARMEEGTELSTLSELTQQLEAHLSEVSEISDPTTVVKQVLRMAEDEASLSRGVGRWIAETQLKHRIAVEGDALQQRLTFGHVEHILSLAQFIEQSPVVDGSWRRFEQAIEFEADYTASEQVAAELESREVGVTVETVGSLRGADFDFVFIAGAVDEEYPAEPTLNRLIPITRAADIDVYPRALPDSMAAVRETFATSEPPTNDPVRAYTQALNRRILAEAARMGTRGVYFGTYDNSARQMSKQVHPSRYLSALERATEGVKSVSEATEVDVPEQVALDTVDDRYRQAVLDSQSLPAEETLATEFGAVRTVIEESDEAVREALATRKAWMTEAIGDE